MIEYIALSVIGLIIGMGMVTAVQLYLSKRIKAIEDDIKIIIYECGIDKDE